MFNVTIKPNSVTDILGQLIDTAPTDQNSEMAMSNIAKAQIVSIVYDNGYTHTYDEPLSFSEMIRDDHRQPTLYVEDTLLKLTGYIESDFGKGIISTKTDSIVAICLTIELENSNRR